MYVRAAAHVYCRAQGAFRLPYTILFCLSYGSDGDMRFESMTFAVSSLSLSRLWPVAAALAMGR